MKHHKTKDVEIINQSYWVRDEETKERVDTLETTVDGKVTANTAITGATKTKITYDSKGLVTAGADLQASDIPDLSLSKITDVTATSTEVNKLAGLSTTATELGYVNGVTSSIQNQLNNKSGITLRVWGGNE